MKELEMANQLELKNTKANFELISKKWDQIRFEKYWGKFSDELVF